MRGWKEEAGEGDAVSKLGKILKAPETAVLPALGPAVQDADLQLEGARPETRRPEATLATQQAECWLDLSTMQPPTPVPLYRE